MNAGKRLAVGLLGLQLALLLVGVALALSLRLPGGESGRYLSELMAFFKSGEPRARLFREWRKTGPRLFDACLDESGQPIDTVSGALKVRTERYISYEVVAVTHTAAANRCSYMASGYSEGFGLYEGEVVQLRLLSAPENHLCLYHYEGDLVRCYSRR